MNQKQKIMNIIDLIINSTLFIMILITWVYMYLNGGDVLVTQGFGSLKYFTILSNLLLGLASLVMVPFNVLTLIRKKNSIPLIPQIIKFAATASTTVTFLTVVLFLIPTMGAEGMLTGSNAVYHLVAPILGFLAFIILEIRPSMKFIQTLFGIVPFGLYAIFYILNFELELVPSKMGSEITYDWYGFAGDGNPLRIAIAVVLMTAATFLISLGLNLLNHMLRIVIYGYEDNEGTTLYESDGHTEKAVYHIDKFMTKKWHVRMSGESLNENSFDTEEAAIEYAKSLTAEKAVILKTHSKKK